MLRRSRPFTSAVLVIGLTACARPSADAHLQRANALLAQSQPREAIVEYRRAVQIDPRRGDLRMQLSEAYESVGDKDMVPEAARAADLLPNDVPAQLRAGRLLLAAHAFPDARARAEKAIALDPANPQALILLGNVLAGMKDFDGALSEYQNAIALNSGDQLAAYENQARLQNFRGDKAAAEANFRKAVAMAPNSVPAREALASFLWVSGRTEEAETTLKAALALAPDDLNVNRALGLLYIESRRARDAEPFFQTIGKKNDSTDGQLALADYYHLTRRVEEARRVLGQLTRKDTNYAAAMTRLAAIDAEERQPAEGLAKTQQVLDRFPNDMSARLLKAQLLAATGKLDEARVVARSISADAPSSTATPGAFMLIGGIDADRGESAEAMRAYEEVLKRLARPFAALVMLANLNLTAGTIDKAETYAQQALLLQPKNPAARSLMVRIWLAQQKTTQANVELAALQKDYPKSPTVLDLVAAQQVAGKQWSAARASYTRAFALHPSDVEAATGLIKLDLLSGNVANAVARVEEGLKRTSPSEAWFVLAAQTYMAAKDYSKAESALERAIQAAPSHLSNYALLGQLLAGQGRLGEARDEFNSMLQRAPRDVGANTMLGVLLEAGGKTEEAERQYRAVLALDDRAAVAANNLAWIYAAGHRQLDDALQLAQKAVQQVPDDPHFNDTLGWVYYQRAAYRDAIRCFEDSARVDPGLPVIHYHLGMANFQAGVWDKARQALTVALASSTPFEGIDEARKTLAIVNAR